MQFKSVATLISSVLLVSFFGWSQQIAPINGVYSPDHTIYAFTNAHVVISPDVVVDNGTLLIQDGIVLGSGPDVVVPPNAVVYDLNGKYIYPSFVELYSNYGLPKVAKREQTKSPQFVSKKTPNFYWNDAIHPQQSAVEDFKPEVKSAESLRKMGFGMVLTHQFNGIMRGSAALVSLGNSTDGNMVVKESAGSYHGLGRGNSTQRYPSSLMGSIALYRQAMYDNQWYAESAKFPENLSLQAISDNQELPQFFVARNYQSVLRVSKIGNEFNVPFIVIAGGDEYKRINEIKSSNVRLVVPLDFPKAYDVADPLDAQYISLTEMKHWELAPSNPAAIYRNHIPFALTAAFKPKMFWKNLRKAVQYGLPKEEALRALTVTPSEYLGMSSQIGTLEKGKKAQFFISDTDVFDRNGKVLENWTGSQRHIIQNAMAIDPTGNYNLNIGAVLYTMEISKTPKGYVVYSSFGGSESERQKGSITIENDLLTINFDKGTQKLPGPIGMVGKVNFKGKIIDGKAQDSKGNWSNWTAIKQKEKSSSTVNPVARINRQELGKVFYPSMAYGDTIIPQRNNYLIKNVMIWTSDSLGKFKGNVLVSNGVIEAIGERLSNPGEYTEIEGQGMHLTPGLVDEHSHIAIKGGANEGGQNNSAEVRIGDVLNSEDINIYRQLAGGVTTAQLLHGSANPIGGQSQIIKLRWGTDPEGLKFQGSSNFIKFALGENVKQSNWGPTNVVRFPQTRMGVEQVYLDAFTRAKAYQKSWDAYNGQTKREAKNNVVSLPRFDLELETLVEILNRQRYITCHSYIQSEMTMLMNVADSMGFKVNTFTHVLEGYKIADKILEHGAFASTFSDWWAYKFEVNDAIPYNAAILTKQGVVTAINSDDGEMGRRLNQEAAKTVKYGGVSEIEALKMVTINPATMLHIDDKIGSILPGKNADLVLWSGHPLSVYSHPVMVMIDGAIYYSQEQNLALQEKIKKERQRLILKMLEAKKSGQDTQKVKHLKPKMYHCNSFEDEAGF